jgi:hypothetical protein
MSRVLPSVLTLMLLLVAAPASTSAQPRRTSSDIQAQIQKSADLQRQALQILTEPERAERLIGRAYTELQTAMSTMLINASGQKSPDPLLKLNEQRMRQALSHLQQASDMLKANRSLATASRRQEGTPPAESGAYLGVVRNNVEQALRITSSVLVL